jgi:Nucleotidyl transferase AbiEii toxin, Type IV TA system
MDIFRKIKNLFSECETKLTSIECNLPSPPANDFADPDDEDFFALLSEILKNNKNKAVLFGAVGMSVYGYQRNTFDVDFMLPEDDFGNFTEILASIGYAKILQTAQYAKFRHKKETFMDIDTVFISANTADEIIDMAEIKTLSGGHRFLCASLETVLATKLHAIRYNNERREGKDVTDMKMLVKINNIDPDSEWFKTLAIKYGGAEVYKTIFNNGDS